MTFEREPYLSEVEKANQTCEHWRKSNLDEGNLAGAHVALEVVDGDLSVMLQVTLLAQDVMDAGHYFVPLIVVSMPANIKNQLHFHLSGSMV